MPPNIQQLELPPGYGNPSKKLDWESVRSRIERADVYWVASTRPDGRPHVVPRDGIWMDDGLWYGGSPETVHNRNIKLNGEVVFHIGSGQEAIIVEGVVSEEVPAPAASQRLAELSFEKYPQYGRVDPAAYKDGVLVLRPRRVFAWTNLPHDATRFIFP